MTDGDFALLCLLGLPVLGSILGNIYFGSEGKPIHIEDSDEVEEYGANDPFCTERNITPWVKERNSDEELS